MALRCIRRIFHAVIANSRKNSRNWRKFIAHANTPATASWMKSVCMEMFVHLLRRSVNKEKANWKWQVQSYRSKSWKMPATNGITTDEMVCRAQEVSERERKNSGKRNSSRNHKCIYARVMANERYINCATPTRILLRRSRSRTTVFLGGFFTLKIPLPVAVVCSLRNKFNFPR